MLELGLSELFLVGIVALIIVGPKDLPKMFRVVGKYVGRAKEMARDFQRSFEDAARESGFEDIKRNFDTVKDFNPNSIAKNAVTGKNVTSESKASEGKISSGNTSENSTDQKDPKVKKNKKVNNSKNKASVGGKKVS